MDGQRPPKSFKRRLFRILAVCLVVVIAALAALPWLVSTDPARVAIVAAANRALAPNKIGLDGISVGWISPITLKGLTLTDAAGKTLVEARLATLDRSLSALALDSSRLGTFTLTDAKVDIERRRDGSIDLVDALVPKRPAIRTETENEAPAKASTAKPIDVTFKIVGGSLKLKSPELAEPLSAENLDMEAHVPATPGAKLSWKIRLAAPTGGLAGQTLGIDGEYDFRADAAAAPDLSLTIKGTRWPLVLAATSGLTTRGKLQGAMAIARASGRWKASGDAKWLELDATGPALSGDRLALEKVTVGFDVEQSDSVWVVRRLALDSPVAWLSASGAIGADGKAPAANLDGKIDLAAVAQQLPHALHVREGLTLERGSARVKLELKSENDVQHASIDAKLSDLVAREKSRPVTIREPAALTGRASRSKSGFSLDVVEMKTGFLDLTASGDLQKGVNLAGTIDLAKLQSQFRELVDFGTVTLTGTGRMAGDYRKTAKGYIARYAVEVRGLNVVGLTTAPLARDAVRFDASASGPMAADGLPTSWQNLRANLKSSEDTVTLAATTQSEITALSGSASFPVTINAHNGRLDSKLVGRWRAKEDFVEFDELRFRLTPVDSAASDLATVAMGVRGTLDLGREIVTLSPLAVVKGRALALGPDGLKIQGFRKTPLAKRSAEVSVAIDTLLLDRALVYWDGAEPNGLAGAFSAHFAMTPSDAGKLALRVNVLAPDLSREGPDAKSRTPEPMGLVYLGTYDPEADRLGVDDLQVVTRYATITAKGTIDAPVEKRVADLTGTLSPDWKTVNALAAAAIEPGARVTGGARAFRVKGRLSGDSVAAVVKGLDAEVGVDAQSADAFGLKLGPTPIVFRASGGTTSMDPIKSTLNNGAVDLKPSFTVDAVQGIALQILPGSTITGVEINDEVSKRVLSYIAPVLDGATNVHGKVNVSVSHADIPITGPPAHTLTLNGDVSFQDVVFAPGKFAGQLFTLVGRPDEPGLKLDQPIHLAVADRRVMQKGLEVPIRRDAKIAINGSVGFDRTLDLRATVPITPKMLGNVSGLDGLVKDKTVIVPISGTVSQPKINRKALEVALKGLGGDELKRELTKKASGLLDRLAPPAEANGKPNAGSGSDLKKLENQLRGLLPK